MKGFDSRPSCKWILLCLILSIQLKFPLFLLSSKRNFGVERGFFLCEAQIIHDRMRLQDEPQLVSFRVLEGVTEPFLLHEDGVEIPGKYVSRQIST